MLRLYIIWGKVLAELSEREKEPEDFLSSSLLLQLKIFLAEPFERAENFT